MHSKGALKKSECVSEKHCAACLCAGERPADRQEHVGTASVVIDGQRGRVRQQRQRQQQSVTERVEHRHAHASRQQKVNHVGRCFASVLPLFRTSSSFSQLTVFVKKSTQAEPFTDNEVAGGAAGAGVDNRGHKWRALCKQYACCAHSRCACAALPTQQSWAALPAYLVKAITPHTPPPLGWLT